MRLAKLVSTMLTGNPCPVHWPPAAATALYGTLYCANKSWTGSPVQCPLSQYSFTISCITEPSTTPSATPIIPPSNTCHPNILIPFVKRRCHDNTKVINTLSQSKERNLPSACWILAITVAIANKNGLMAITRIILTTAMPYLFKPAQWYSELMVRQNNNQDVCHQCSGSIRLIMLVEKVPRPIFIAASKTLVKYRG